MLCLFCFISGSMFAQTATPPSDGDGSIGDPYKIETLNNLYWIAANSDQWNKYYIQTFDIDASATSGWSDGGWSPIGNNTTKFTGGFDGNGYLISGLYINRAANYQGMFGYTNGATFTNIKLESVTITGNDEVGGLVGMNTASTISNSYVTGTITGANEAWDVGGLVGYNVSSTISDSYTSGTVTAAGTGIYYLGGFIGDNEYSSITNSHAAVTVDGECDVGGFVGFSDECSYNNCYATGNVNSTDGWVGGLCGESYYDDFSNCYATGSVMDNSPSENSYAGGLVGANSGAISNSYATGSVEGYYYIGGLVGDNYGAITNCYSVGSVTGTTYTGGLVGENSAADPFTNVINSFWNTVTSGQGSSEGGTGKTTDEMKGITPGNTILDWGWSTSIWERIGNNYPRLIDNPDPTLPVTLSTFTAQFIENIPTLYWETQSETDNMGWFVYRNSEEEFSSSEMLTEKMIPGNGTTTEPNYYNFEDAENLTIGQTYYYWLESMDYSGIANVYDQIAQITIPDPSVNPPNNEPPIVYNFKNVPNPVVGSTQFQFTLDTSSMISVSVYNLKGELVRILPSVMTQPDEAASIYWNGKDSNGNELKPGVYLYKLLVNGNTEETKKLILMR